MVYTDERKWDNVTGGQSKTVYELLLPRAGVHRRRMYYEQSLRYCYYTHCKYVSQFILLLVY